MNGTHYQKIFGQNAVDLDIAVMKLYVYKDRLYVGTMNLIGGASLYVMDINDELMPIFKNGNGDRRNQYVWYMQGYSGRLYIGTLKTRKGAFDLYSSTDPESEELIVETDDGFGNEGQYGVRSMVVYQGKLM
eukprot:378107_1